MTTTTQHDVCTCGETSDIGHDDSCDLWLNDEWLEGDAIWVGQRLYTAAELAVWGIALEEADELEDVEDKIAETEGCTCKPHGAVVPFNAIHDNTCMLWKHLGWSMAQCDWDHASRSFVNHHTTVWDLDDETDLVPVDGTVLECACKPPKKWMCQDCGVERQNETDPWLAYGALGGKSWAYTPGTPPLGGVTKTVTTGGYGYETYKQCRHYDVRLEFPNGVAVWPSSVLHLPYGKTDIEIPDHALYMDSSWKPRSVATFIPWRDYGLPTIPWYQAAEAISEAYQLAVNGLTVEVGCIGGHGRTGTVLACMGVLAGMTADDAVDWVRANYCDKAVEGDVQQWWVHWFDGYVTGVEVPPTPPEKPAAAVSVTAVTTLEERKRLTDKPAYYGMVLSDKCPVCKGALAIFNNTLACNTTQPKKCEHYNGLPRCPECKAFTDAHPSQGKMCWNMHCTLNKVDIPKVEPPKTPVFPPTTATKTKTYHPKKKGERKDWLQSSH